VGLLFLPEGSRGAEQHHRQAILMFDMHHIISDGMSIGILVTEFMELYAGNQPPALRLQYKDYSQWYQRQAPGAAMRQQEAYWLNQFAGEIPLLNLPVDFPRPVVQVFAGAHTVFWVGAEETAVLQTLALEANTTLFGVLFSIYTIFLARLSGQEDIIIGTPVTGRKHHDLPGVIGMFVNMLALRNFPAGNRTFPGFLKETGARTMGALENQEYPFEDLVERLSLNRDASRNPLFDAAFALHDPDMPRLEIPGLKVTPYEYDPGTAKFDLTLIAEQVEHRLHFTLQYCTKLFKTGTIERFIGYFKQLVSSIVKNPGQKLSASEMLSWQEKQQLLFEFNDMGANYPNDKNLLQLFEVQVKKTPDHVAMVGLKLQNTNYILQTKHKSQITKPLPKKKAGAGGTLRVEVDACGGLTTPDDSTAFSAQLAQPVSLTYHELNEQSDGLARLLSERGAQPNTIVGIMVERSVDMILGILSILKTGSAYLPIDPESPGERIDYMLKDSNARLIIDETFFAPLFFKIFLPLFF
jgi:non-ribosomal peptide synthetase component F